MSAVYPSPSTGTPSDEASAVNRAGSAADPDEARGGSNIGSYRRWTTTPGQNGPAVAPPQEPLRRCDPGSTFRMHPEPAFGDTRSADLCGSKTWRDSARPGNLAR